MWTSADWKRLQKVEAPRDRIFILSLTLLLFVFWWLTGSNWALGLTGLFTFLVLVRPGWVHRLNHSWHCLGLVLAWLLQPIFLILIYFLVFTPIGLLKKKFSKPKDGSWVRKQKDCNFEKAF